MCRFKKNGFQRGYFFLHLIFLQYVKGKHFRTIPAKKLSARFVWCWFYRRVDISRLGTQVLFPAFLAKRPPRSKQLSGSRRWTGRDFGIRTISTCVLDVQVKQKMISRRVNFDRVSAVLKLINFVHFGWCLFYRGFIYQGWGRRLYFSLFFPPNFITPLGRSSYHGTEEVQDLAAFLFAPNSCLDVKVKKQ